MKIAIDESGDTGRKMNHGSSKWFVLAAAIVPESSPTCGITCQAVEAYKRQFVGNSELHFSHNSHEQHLDFLHYMHDKDFVYAAAVIDKQKLMATQPLVLSSKMSLMFYAFDHLFDQLKPWLDSPIVLVDSSGSQYFNQALGHHLLRLYGSDQEADYRKISQVRVVDSAREPLVQLADYIAGAIRHHVDPAYQSEAYEQYLADRGKIFFC
jgi:hypothetical protein